MKKILSFLPDFVKKDWEKDSDNLIDLPEVRKVFEIVKKEYEKIKDRKKKLNL